jgi:CoA:oxalate CoA-transferase
MMRRAESITLAQGASSTVIQQPLRGLRVIDLTRVLAGPFCTLTLADMGAEVIKIELPGRGDDSRSYPPMIPDSEDSGYFWRANRGKKSVTIDLRRPEGAALLVDLARRSDVLVENFAPGTIDRYGIGYEVLSAANPRLILCSISGFGQAGPMAAAPAYDIVAQALSGMMSITGLAGGEPVRCGVSIGDLTAALYGVIAILGALRGREQTGRGQHLDIALLDCQVALLEDALSRYSVLGTVPGPLGSRHPSITPFQQFRSSDGFFVVAVGNEELWKQFCQAIELPNLRSDARFVSNAQRTSNHAELEQLLQDHFLLRPRRHWLDRLEAAKVPCAPISDLSEVSRNPHLHARNMILKADHPTFDGLIVPGSPLKTVGDDEIPDTRAPALGADTDEVLGSLLKIGQERLTELRQSGII